MLVMDPLEAVTFDGLEKLTYFNTCLSSEEKEQLRHVLVGNAEIFAWSHLDMVRIDLALDSHKLNVITSAKPMR